MLCPLGYNGSMNQGVKLYDVVTLTEDLPAQGLVRGQVGTVVEQYAPDAFEIEFSDNNGRTYALVTLRTEQFFPLRYEPLQVA